MKFEDQAAHSDGDGYRTKQIGIRRDFQSLVTEVHRRLFGSGCVGLHGAIPESTEQWGLMLARTTYTFVVVSVAMADFLPR